MEQDGDVLDAEQTAHRPDYPQARPVLRTHAALADTVAATVNNTYNIQLLENALELPAKGVSVSGIKASAVHRHIINGIGQGCRPYILYI